MFAGQHSHLMQLNRGPGCSEGELFYKGWLSFSRMALLLRWLAGWLTGLCCAMLCYMLVCYLLLTRMASALLDSLYVLADLPSRC